MASPTQVTIIRKPNGKLGASPDPAAINRDNQKLQWVIDVPGMSWPPAGGIVPKKKNLPTGFSPWPGDTPSKSGDMYVADAADPLPHGSAPKKYKYNIFLVDEKGKNFVLAATEDFEEMVKKYGKEHVVKVDPDIQNDPLP